MDIKRRLGQAYGIGPTPGKASADGDTPGSGSGGSKDAGRDRGSVPIPSGRAPIRRQADPGPAPAKPPVVEEGW